MPQRGEVYVVAFGDGKERPVVVLSRDDLNRGDWVTVIPFTTAKVEERKTLRYCVHFNAGTGGLSQECVAKADEIARIEKVRLVPARRIGRITAPKMAEIVIAVRWMIRDDTLP